MPTSSLERAVVPWHRMTRQVVESPFPGVFKKHVEVALRDIVDNIGDVLGLD